MVYLFHNNTNMTTFETILALIFSTISLGTIVGYFIHTCVSCLNHSQSELGEHWKVIKSKFNR